MVLEEVFRVLVRRGTSSDALEEGVASPSLFAKQFQKSPNFVEFWNFNFFWPLIFNFLKPGTGHVTVIP